MRTVEKKNRMVTVDEDVQEVLSVQVAFYQIRMEGQRGAEKLEMFLSSNLMVR